MRNKGVPAVVDLEDKGSLVPRLRFAEFRDAGEWAEKRLSEACEINPTTDSLPETFIYIDLESVFAGRLVSKKTVRRKDAPSRAQRFLQNNDTIYQIVRPYQRNNLYCDFDDENNYVASTGYAQLRALGDGRFLYQLVHTNGFVNKVIAKCTGSNYPAVNTSDLAEIEITIPRLSEQQKIADCLSSLDDLITWEAQKLDTLKVHKKGLMQQLFPAEGETVPRLRFAEFRGTGEWEVKPLEAMCFLITKGTTPTTLGFKFIDSGVSFIKIESIDRNGSINSEKIAYISDECDQALKRSRLEENDILFSIAGALGIVAVVPNHVLPANTNQALGIIRVKPGYSYNYLARFLSSYPIQSEILKIKAGAAQLNISLNQLSSFQILLPGRLEQKTLVECLSSLDDLITSQSEKVTALKLHKKGLMQQLFPVLDEAPG